MTPAEVQRQVIKIEYSLKKFAHRLTFKNADAKDLVQETILKVLTNQDKYTNNLNFRGWAFTIMRNTFINTCRTKTRHNTHIDSTAELYFMNQVKATDGNNPESSYSASEINQNIEQLQDTLRVPFQMFLNGYKYKEIAEGLNLSMETVKNRIFLSRKQLINKLEK